MDGTVDILVIIGMFVLRLGVPLVFTVGVGYLFRRLDARWEAAAESRPETVRSKAMAAAKEPCWKEKGCSEDQRSRCPACHFGDIPCWLARLRSEGRLPTKCKDCGRFTTPAAQPVRV